MDNTIIQQGFFVGNGNSVTIDIRSDVDWMTVYNTTQADGTQTTAVGVKYYWQRGFASDAKWVTFATNATNASNLEQYIVGNGFTLIDSSLQTPGALQSIITAISSAAIPVVTTGSAHGLSVGDVVRLINVAGGQQLGGIDFAVGYNTFSGTTFDLSYMAQIVAATTGSFRKINFNPIFYPRRRVITQVSTGSTTTVITSVKHQYQVGQAVRFNVPAQFGMIEINGLIGNVIAVDTSSTVNSFTVDIDSSSFTAFTFPLTAAVPFTPAEVVPVGEDTATANAYLADPTSDATVNTSYLGIKLAGGQDCPGGESGDVLFWVAGKSFSVDNGSQIILS